MSVVSAMMPRYSVAWWAGAFFVNAFLTGPRAYFGAYLVYSSLFDRVPLLENLTFLLKVGTVCGLLDAVDGRAAKLLGVQSWFGRIADPTADAMFFLSIGLVVLSFENFAPEGLVARGIPTILLGAYGVIVEIMRLQHGFERSSTLAKLNVGVLGIAALAFFGGRVLDVEWLRMATFWLHCSVCCATVALYDYWHYHEKKF